MLLSALSHRRSCAGRSPASFHVGKAKTLDSCTVPELVEGRRNDGDGICRINASSFDPRLLGLRP